MRVLIVEDEQHVATRLDERLGRLKPRIDTIIAGSRTSGIEALQSSEFDFIVCDLRLPPQDGGVDTDEAHGLAVMVWIGSDCSVGEISGEVPASPPGTDDSDVVRVSPEEEAQYVMEINGGEAAALGLAANDPVSFAGTIAGQYGC